MLGRVDREDRHADVVPLFPAQTGVREGIDNFGEVDLGLRELAPATGVFFRGVWVWFSEPIESAATEGTVKFEKQIREIGFRRERGCGRQIPHQKTANREPCHSAPQRWGFHKRWRDYVTVPVAALT